MCRPPGSALESVLGMVMRYRENWKDPTAPFPSHGDDTDHWTLEGVTMLTDEAMLISFWHSVVYLDTQRVDMWPNVYLYLPMNEKYKGFRSGVLFGNAKGMLVSVDTRRGGSSSGRYHGLVIVGGHGERILWAPHANRTLHGSECQWAVGQRPTKPKVCPDDTTPQFVHPGVLGND